MEKQGEIILYQPDEAIKLEVRLEDETVWLTQAQIAELFQRDRTVITKHINNVFKEKELEEKSNVHFLHIARACRAYRANTHFFCGFFHRKQCSNGD